MLPFVLYTLYKAAGGISMSSQSCAVKGWQYWEVKRRQFCEVSMSSQSYDGRRSRLVMCTEAVFKYSICCMCEFKVPQVTLVLCSKAAPPDLSFARRLH
jgi:hypothetical protein